MATKTKDLKTRYNEEIRAQLKEELKLANNFEIPKLSKIVINMGVGEASKNAKMAENIVKQSSILFGFFKFFFTIKPVTAILLIN